MSGIHVSRVGQLIRMLASDQDGEVVAAARALKKILEQHGKDLNDFAAFVERAMVQRPVQQTVIIMRESVKQNQKRRYEESKQQ
jgi:hypothetical protein